MRIRLNRAQIIDRDNINIGAARFINGTHNIAPDAAKAVNGNANLFRHNILLSVEAGR